VCFFTSVVIDFCSMGLTLRGTFSYGIVVRDFWGPQTPSPNKGAASRHEVKECEKERYGERTEMKGSGGKGRKREQERARTGRERIVSPQRTP